MEAWGCHRDKLGPQILKMGSQSGLACEGLRRPVNTPANLCRSLRAYSFLRGLATASKGPIITRNWGSWVWSCPQQAGFSVLLSSAAEREDGGGKQRGVTPPPKVQDWQGLSQEQSRSLHRTALNTSENNHEACLGTSPSEPSFSGMGKNHVVAENLVMVVLTVSAGRRENVSQHVTELSHYTPEGPTAAVWKDNAQDSHSVGQTWWAPLPCILHHGSMRVLEKHSAPIDIQWVRV